MLGDLLHVTHGIKKNSNLGYNGQASWGPVEQDSRCYRAWEAVLRTKRHQCSSSDEGPRLPG